MLIEAGKKAIEKVIINNQAIMEHLREKVEQEGLTVIFITHDTELAAAWADQIYRLEDTALVEKSAEEVL